MQTKLSFSRTGYTNTLFCLNDLDPEPVTLISELDLDNFEHMPAYQ